MDDLISRQAAVDALDKRFDGVPMELTTEILELRRDLRERIPSAQPEIIRCKECKWYDMAKNEANGFCREHGCTFFSWDFCSWAEREKE